MPENSVIVGMDVLPSNMEQIDEQIKLELFAGPTNIEYIFGIAPDTTPNPPESSFDYTTIALIAGPIAAAGAGVAILLKKKQSKPQIQVTEKQTQLTEKQTPTESIDTDTIFNLRPEMREDDKEIIKFISKNGGQVFESDLRKKFLQPRTTMWRAVKRLERLGVVEIYKKDLLNMVKLRNDLEEEN